VDTTAAQALTNKDLSGAGNTFPATLATLTGTQTLTNKTLGSGTVLPSTVVQTTGAQTVTGKDLSSGNTFPASFVTATSSAMKIQNGKGSFTVDSSGRIAIPCSLGVIPTGVFTSFQDSRYMGGPDTDNSSAASIFVYVRSLIAIGTTVTAGGLLAAGTIVVCRYLFIV
jgi:hypothetical protein